MKDSGKYTAVIHTRVNTTQLPNLVRSATAPEIRATVMMAKVMPKALPSRSSEPISPPRPKLAVGSATSPPRIASPEDMDAPHSTQTTATMAMEIKLIIIMFSTPLARVMPP